jgi:cell wall-associated NlpC family hydrolase
MITDEQRRAIIAEAKTWLGTPFRARSMVKGAGCDCATFAVGVYRATGMLPEDFELPKQYSVHFGLHAEKPEELDFYLRFAREAMLEIPAGEAKPGDLLVLNLARTWSHGGILLDWPMVIHAEERNGVRISNMEIDPPFRRREKKFFTPIV